MKKRIITGAVILIVVAIAITSKIWTPYAFDALVLFLSIVGTYEIAQAMNKMGRPTSVPFAVAFSVILYGGICAGYILKWVWTYYLYYYLIAILGMAIIVFISQLFIKRDQGDDRLKESWDGMINTVFVCIYPIVFFSALYFINHFNNHISIAGASIITDSPFYMFILLLVFTVTMTTDTMAMLTGMTIKGPKLCPKISPKKTISGAIGGLVFGALSAVLLFLLFSISDAFVVASNFLKLNIIWIAIIGAVGAFLTQIGDIFASLLKRKAEIKDYGNIFPGHGGVMDRVDGLIFNAVWIAGVIGFISRLL